MIIGGSTLDCIIWSFVDSVNLTHIKVQHLGSTVELPPNYSVTFGLGLNHIRL